MKNKRLIKGIILSSGKISKDKINLAGNHAVVRGNGVGNGDMAVDGRNSVI